jgi:hypothetical protein
LYKREVELILEEEKPRPRPSSELRTRDAAGKHMFQMLKQEFIQEFVAFLKLKAKANLTTSK